MLKVIFNKYPFLKELKNIPKGKKQLEVEQKIIQLSNDLEKTNEHMKNPFEKYIRREQDVLIRANDAMYRHNPIIWDNKVNKLFKERYGITLTDIYNKFTKGYTGSRPLDITNYVLKKVLNKNTLMVFPLRGSLFNYYLTRGVIAELKRLGLAKNELNAVTITADTFKHWNSFYNMEAYTYGTSYHDIAERAPDIISEQLTNILKKHKNTAQISIVDFKNTGFQKDYIYHYIKKHYNKENKNHPELDFLSVNEEQKFNFSNKETIDPTDLVNKRVDKESAGAKGYIGTINSKSTLSNITKMKEMLEIAGRMLLRSELKIRGTI